MINLLLEYGCGEYYDLNHALSCKKEGLVTARHNETRYLNCDLCSLAGLGNIGAYNTGIHRWWYRYQGLDYWFISKRILETPENCIVWYLHSKYWCKISAKPIVEIHFLCTQIYKEREILCCSWVKKSNLYANYCLLWSNIWQWSGI